MNFLLSYLGVMQAQMSSLAGKAELELLYRTFEERALHMAPLDVDAEDTNTAEDHSTNRASPAESLEREDSDVSDTESIPYSERSTASTKSKGSDFNINTFGDSEDEKESSADSSSPDEDSEGMSDSSLDGEEFLHKGPTPEEVHQRKLADPDRLHPELWFNEKGQVCAYKDACLGMCEEWVYLQGEGLGEIWPIIIFVATLRFPVTLQVCPTFPTAKFQKFSVQ